MPSDVFDQLGEIAATLPPDRWMLVGGLMVHAHATLAEIAHQRPTVDADLVVEMHAGNYGEAARSLIKLGYSEHQPIDHRAPFHRFRRGSEHVDLMTAENAHARYAGRSVLRVPGARSALKRTVNFTLPTGLGIRIPDLASALSLKGAAYQLPGSNRERHLQDGVTLFACADNTVTDLSASMRRNVNQLINGLDSVDAWTASDARTRRKAVRTVLSLRPDWAVPAFLLPQRGRP